MASQSSPSVSYIPVMATPVPRKASSRNALGLPQFSLLPTPRSASQGSPIQASPSSTSSSVKPSVSPSPAPGTSGIPKFRTFRNMLPFGPKQANVGNGSPPVSYLPTSTSGVRHRRSLSSMTAPSNHESPKSGFLTFGPRSSFSMNRRSPALQSPNRSRSEDHTQSPVISIHAPVIAQSTSTTQTTPAPVQSVTLPTPQELLQLSIVRNPIGGADSPRLELDLSIARSGDLSTIIESELSSMSISKHIPPLDASENSALQPSTEEDEADSSSNELILADLARRIHRESVTILKSEDMDVSTTSPAQLAPANRSANFSSSWETGLAEFRKSMGSPLYSNDENLVGASVSTSPTTAQSPLGDISPEETSSRSSPHPALDGGEHEGDRQISFDLSSLDPDLAALLSPHNIPPRRNDAMEAAIAAAVDAVTPPPPMSLSPSPSPESEPDEVPRRTSVDMEDSGSVANSKRMSGESRRRAHITSLGLQSSPPRRSRPSSLAMSSSSQSATDPRRSSSDIPHTAKRPGFPSIPGMERESKESPLGRASDDLSRENVLSVSKRPLLGRSYSALGNSISGGPTKHRPLTPRLTTPARPSTATGAAKARVASDSRPVLRASRASEEQARGYAEDSISPFGRSASALGLSMNMRRPLGATTDRPSSALSRSVQPRTRRRSLSVNETHTPSSFRRQTDWINPRTEKAFAAAGLLNRDPDTRDRSASLSTSGLSRPESRLRASARITTDHDFRASSGQNTSLYVPSRMGQSGLSRSSSWGRRESSSRYMSVAELTSGRVDSPVTVTSSTPTSAGNTRTAFSSSTATSYSGGSPQQQFQHYQLETTIQALKDKHSLEMEALLSALGDSQRTARSLREENGQLRGRINDLEEQMNDLVEQLDAIRRSAASQQAPNYARSIFSQSRPGSRAGTEPAPKRKSHSRLHSYVAPLAADESEDVAEGQTTMRESMARSTPSLVAMASERNARKRSSTASSVFPILPSNMSMLLHEDGDSDNSALYSNYQTQSRPASPTILVSRLTAPNTSNKGKHISRPSISSIGSIDLSVVSMPSSPRSLKLNPEHEKHLGDMMSIDFSVIASDE